MFSGEGLEDLPGGSFQGRLDLANLIGQQVFRAALDLGALEGDHRFQPQAGLLQSVLGGFFDSLAALLSALALVGGRFAQGLQLLLRFRGKLSKRRAQAVALAA